MNTWTSIKLYWLNLHEGLNYKPIKLPQMYLYVCMCVYVGGGKGK